MNIVFNFPCTQSIEVYDLKFVDTLLVTVSDLKKKYHNLINLHV